MTPQYLKNNHVTYYVITQVGVYAAQQWYVITSDVTWDSRTAGITNKLPEAGVQTSYVHSSIKCYIKCSVHVWVKHYLGIHIPSVCSTAGMPPSRCTVIGIHAMPLLMLRPSHHPATR